MHLVGFQCMLMDGRTTPSLRYFVNSVSSYVHQTCQNLKHAPNVCKLSPAIALVSDKLEWDVDVKQQQQRGRV